MNQFIFHVIDQKGKVYYGFLKAVDGREAKERILEYCHLHGMKVHRYDLQGVMNSTFQIRGI